MSMLESSFVSHVAGYVKKQIELGFPDNLNYSEQIFVKITSGALFKLRKCFQHINSPYYQGPFQDKFNPYNGDHWTMFLYLCSRESFLTLNDEILSSKFFLLNKMRHSVDIFYKVELPEVFVFGHPLGTVLGNAKYGNFLCVYQGCTVGSKKGIFEYAEFGENTTLYSNSTVIGKCKIGNNVTFGANSSIIDTTISDNTTVLGFYPHQRLVNNQGIKEDVFLY